MMMEDVMDTGRAAFRFPWLSLSISVGGVLLIIFVTMMYTVTRLARENLIDALRDELA